MIIRNLTSANDWTFGAGIQNYRRNLDAIELNIKTRLQSWKGDCFFAPLEGVDYNNYLDVRTKDFLDSDVKRVILQSEGVIKITVFGSTLERSTRAYSAQVEVVTIFGVAEVEI